MAAAQGTSSTDWRGKVALVTGASSGIGRAVAARLAAEGMIVAACARRVERLEALQEQAQGKILALPCDLRDVGDIERMFGQIREAHGGVDVLINNAGLGRAEPLSDGDDEAWREMLEVNVLALSICTREAIRDMRRRERPGHVVHVSSMSGHRVPASSGGMYAATKHAVRALTEGLRRELRALGLASIRISSISPGYVETEFAQHYSGSKEAAEELYEQYPMVQPEELAELIWTILRQPPHVQIHDLLLRPTEQEN